MRLHYDIKVTGKVQKVGFRFHAHVEAAKNSLFGFVRNESDGSVYIEVEGEEDDLERYLAWCRRGTTLAIVENVEVRKAPLVGFDQFSIRH